MYRQTPSHRTQESNLRPPKMPDRPLVPYMRFSKKMWQKVRADNPESPLWDLGKIIGQLWNAAPSSEKAIYQQEYEADKVEYEKMMKNYNASYAQYMAAKSRVKSTHQDRGVLSSRKGADTSIATEVFIQPVDEEDPFELSGKRLSAIRYDRNNRLMAELFSQNYLPDPRTFVPQQRIEHFRRQAQSLEQHQNKLNDELAKIEELFCQRKRAIEMASDAYIESMKKVCQEKPKVDQAYYSKIVEEHKDHLLRSWEQYESRQKAIQEKLEADLRANPVLSDLIISRSPQETDTSQQNLTEEFDEEEKILSEKDENESKEEIEGTSSGSGNKDNLREA